MVPLCSDIYNISRLTLFTPSKQLGIDPLHGPFGHQSNHQSNHSSKFQSPGAVISVRNNADKLIVVHANLSISTYRFSSFPDGEGSPFQLRPERTRTLPCAAISRSEVELRRRYG